MSEIHADGGPLHTPPRFLEHLLRGLRMALVLTALTQILHFLHLPWLGRLDHVFTSAVVSLLHVAEEVEDRDGGGIDSGAPSVQLVELGADLRVLAMETSRPDAEAVLRLDGIRPLSRDALASLLDELADCLDPAAKTSCVPGARRPPTAVLAIDFDIAPLNNSADERLTSARMRTALAKLRKHVDVVAIALDRSDTPSRALRNDFMREAGCSTRAGAKPGADRAASSLDHPLYFASPRFFLRPQEAPLQYLTGAKREAHGADKGPDFPGLGTIAHLAQLGLARNDAAGRAAATLYCEQAWSPQGVLLEDTLAEKDWPGELAREQEHAYEPRYFNWSLLKSEKLRFMPLSWRAPPAGETWARMAVDQIREQGLKAPILLLSVDGGGGNDKFPTPGALPNLVSGATLHALQMLSLEQPLQEATWTAALADLMIGALVVLASTALHVYIFHPWQNRLPGVTMLMVALVNLLLALFFSYVSLHLAGWLMVSRHSWVNPLYVVLGLAAHAFAEAHEPPLRTEKPPRPWWRLLGHLLFKPAPPPAPRLDAGLNFGLRWLILLLGLGALIRQSLLH